MSKKCFSSSYYKDSLSDIMIVVWASDVFTWRVLVATGNHSFLDLLLKQLNSCDTNWEDPQSAAQ